VIVLKRRGVSGVSLRVQVFDSTASFEVKLHVATMWEGATYVVLHVSSRVPSATFEVGLMFLAGTPHIVCHLF
jgi:hypothetical protein